MQSLILTVAQATKQAVFELATSACARLHFLATKPRHGQLADVGYAKELRDDLLEQLNNPQLKLSNDAPKVAQPAATAAALRMSDTAPSLRESAATPSEEVKRDAWTELSAGWKDLLSALGKDLDNLGAVAYLFHGDTQVWVMQNIEDKEVWHGHSTAQHVPVCMACRCMQDAKVQLDGMAAALQHDLRGAVQVVVSFRGSEQARCTQAHSLPGLPTALCSDRSTRGL
jgi:hypothetical protein